MSLLQKNVLRKNLPPFPPLPVPQGAGNLCPDVAGVSGSKRHKRDYSPLPWKEYFDRCQDITTSPGNCFRVYFRGNSGPVLLLLHGGGHSALSWAVFAVSVSKLVECEVVAVDLRGHGDSSTLNNSDLSAETLVNDVNNIVESLFGERELFPPVVLVGHSMGGAIATRTAANDVIKSLVGLAIIDVVEGTAIDSLGSMQSYLRDRPSSFKSLENAIEWSIRSGQLRNVESARISMPGQVQCLGREVIGQTISSGGVIKEEEEEEEEEEKREDTASESVSQEGDSGKELAAPSSSLQASSGGGGGGVMQCTWRIKLEDTERHWSGWFDGLSKLFLTISVPKMLILAGVDRLDKELTIGQMQGKFQMQVLSRCGHCVHEDAPDKVAEVIGGFLIRHKFARQKEDSPS